MTKIIPIEINFKVIKFDLFNIIKINKNFDINDHKIYEIIEIITDYFRFNEKDVANIVINVAIKSEKDIDLTQYQIAKIPKEKRTLIYQFPDISYILFTILTHLSYMKMNLNGLKRSRSNLLFSLDQFEKDIKYMDKYISNLDFSLNHAKLMKDENQVEQYQIAIAIFKKIKENKDQGINFLYKLSFSLNHNEIQEKDVLYKHRSYISKLYEIFTSYKITPKKIHKSAALKIFNGIYPKYIENKFLLCEMISHLFSRLEVEIQIDHKKAHEIKPIRSFYYDTLYDYSTSKISIFN
ncbi:hypothetical protein [Arcobacter sp. L]|uniref:hypothetical protein n=1 Tax=Arcobacter sp. L TaxID=944547 RepID=UPI000229603B|nr:hypothetical protein [Arcobacter sp. L]BAK74042.1 hypothetical protein ABLL_2167 [Arcobacter sp. L]